jgi:hypothetical protein
VTTYRIDERPRFVREDDGRLPGHYEAVFVRDDGERIDRFLTDKGRAEILRALEEGRAELSAEEFETHSVAPALDALLERMDREAGEGA